MAEGAFVRARIDQDIRDRADDVLRALGLTISDVVRMTLTRIANEHALPFELTRPNPETIAAIEEARELRLRQKQRFVSGADLVHDLEENGGQAAHEPAARV